MSKNDLYYDGPTQVKYFKNGAYYGAIAYHDFLINGEDGNIIPIDKILKSAARNEMSADLAIVEFDWVSLNDIILYGKASD